MYNQQEATFLINKKGASTIVGHPFTSLHGFFVVLRAHFVLQIVFLLINREVSSKFRAVY